MFAKGCCKKAKSAGFHDFIASCFCHFQMLGRQNAACLRLLCLYHFFLCCCYTICVTAHRIHTFIPLSVIKVPADSIDCIILTGMTIFGHHRVQFGSSHVAICNCACSLSMARISSNLTLSYAKTLRPRCPSYTTQYMNVEIHDL